MKGIPMTDSPALSCTDLEVALPDGTILLPRTSLTVRTGQIVALTGASGAGKTTLLRAALGHLPPAALPSGRIDVLGHDVLSLPARDLRDLRRSRIGYVGQDPGSMLNPRMTVRRLVTETMAPTTRSSAEELLALCRLPCADGLAERRRHAISGGQQRRVALARALAREPRLLLLDEPTAGMDRSLRDSIARLLRALATERGIAIVMTCHDPALIDSCADRSIALTGSTPPAATPVATHRPPQRPHPVSEPVTGLAARKIEVAFGKGTRRHLPLQGVDLTVPPASAIGLTGPSGTGKSLLLRVLAGLHPTAEGSIVLDGDRLELKARRRTRIQQRRIRLVPQDPLSALNPSRSVGATLARPLTRLGGTARSDVRAAVGALLQQVGLPADTASRYPAQLSGGQRQRVSIARALAADPDYLLCDEITSALDPATGIEIMNTLAGLRAERGMALLLVSHQLDLVHAYTDEAHLLEHGRITRVQL
ncbi:ATP-binding cassette domain-containing protein [Sphaerisporangium sp. NPDC051017]|uniref:ABC transporter ATP-binding protein n=1 Tax=Sphaerisporangium sp. NPDC051017 TaxID=3154636 RepID=UPI0034137BDC